MPALNGRPCGARYAQPKRCHHSRLDRADHLFGAAQGRGGDGRHADLRQVGKLRRGGAAGAGRLRRPLWRDPRQVTKYLFRLGFTAFQGLSLWSHCLSLPFIVVSLPFNTLVFTTFRCALKRCAGSQQQWCGDLPLPRPRHTAVHGNNATAVALSLPFAEVLLAVLSLPFHCNRFPSFSAFRCVPTVSLPFAAFLRFLCLSLHITIFHRLSLSRAFNAFCLCCHHLINFRCMQVGCLGPAVAEDGLDKPSARPRTAALILSIYPVYPLPLAGGPIGSGEGASAQ